MGEQIDPIGDVPEPKARPKRAFGEECKACSRGEPILGGLGVRPCEERPCEAKAAEDKPATSEVEVREDAPPGVEWPPPSLETSGLRPPAPSEDEETLAETVRKLSGGLDTVSHRPGSSEFAGETFPRKVAEPSEGEKLGLLFWAHYQGAVQGWPDKLTWDELSAPDRKAYGEAASRFRAECIVPYDEVVRAARAYLGVTGGDGTDGDGGDEFHYLEVALSALPDQAEAAKDKSRRSDEELGYSLQRWLLDEGLAEIALTAEEAGWFGAAIRARTEAKSP